MKCPECNTQLKSMIGGYFGHPVEIKHKNTDNDPFSSGGNISIWYTSTCSLIGIIKKKW